jgi:hypothetical protein
MLPSWPCIIDAVDAFGRWPVRPADGLFRYCPHGRISSAPPTLGITLASCFSCILFAAFPIIFSFDTTKQFAG